MKQKCAGGETRNNNIGFAAPGISASEKYNIKHLSPAVCYFCQRMADGKSYKPKLTGGLFHGTEARPRPLAPSKSTPAFLHSEADEQAAFFDLLRMTAPRPPVAQRRITKGQNKDSLALVDLILDERFINHPLYVLTRVRHIPNEGERNALNAMRQGIKAGASDVYLDAARRGFSGLRFEFKILKGVISDEQKAERIWLDRENYFAHYVFHHLEAILLLAFYLDLDPKTFVGFPAHKYAVRGFAPETAHDALCGCSLKISQLYQF